MRAIAIEMERLEPGASSDWPFARNDASVRIAALSKALATVGNCLGLG